MKASILIVSKNRREELEFTLNVLAQMIDFSIHEVLVFLDGCTDGSSVLEDKMKWVNWYSSEKSIGASSARHYLYPKAQSQYLIGLDDDAHPLSSNFIDLMSGIFEENPNVGIIAFQEIKGVFNSNLEALNSVESTELNYLTNEFIGSGFAIRRDVYRLINGFPVWIDIYGEESCVALEVLANGFDILYSNKIKVNHRVDKEVRRKSGQNYFRFGKQLKNTTYYYIIYHRYPLINILKLYRHNFIKYATNDKVYFTIFFKTIIETLIGFPGLIKYRKPVSKKIIKSSRSLRSIKF